MRIVVFLFALIFIGGCQKTKSPEFSYSDITSAIESIDADIKRILDLHMRAGEAISKEGWKAINSKALDKAQKVIRR
jgi:N-methylhydantoinase B/oxoprolinase/acetone carboxylase alpha subunit